MSKPYNKRECLRILSARISSKFLLAHHYDTSNFYSITKGTACASALTGIASAILVGVPLVSFSITKPVIYQVIHLVSDRLYHII